MLPSAGRSVGREILFRALFPIPLMSTWYLMLSACLTGIAPMRLQHSWENKHYMHKHSFLQYVFN